MDALECPRYHGRMRIVGAVTDRSAVTRILLLLGQNAEPPTISRPPAPPDTHGESGEACRSSGEAAPHDLRDPEPPRKARPVDRPLGGASLTPWRIQPSKRSLFSPGRGPKGPAGEPRCSTRNCSYRPKPRLFFLLTGSQTQVVSRRLQQLFDKGRPARTPAAEAATRRIAISST